MVKHSKIDAGKISKMKKDTPKYRVLSIYPNAITVEDMDATKSIYKSDWANKCRFAIGYFKDISNTKQKNLKSSYRELTNNNNWVFLVGWQKTPQQAWKKAWQIIESTMLAKFEE